MSCVTQLSLLSSCSFLKQLTRRRPDGGFEDLDRRRAADASRGSRPGEDTAHAVEPGRVRARCRCDRPRPVCLAHPVAALSHLQRALAVLAADAHADLRDLRLWRSRNAAI